MKRVCQGHKAKQHHSWNHWRGLLSFQDFRPGTWLCSHTTVVSKYALSKYCSGLLRLAESVFPLVCLLPVQLEWLEANKSPLSRYHPGPSNCTLLTNSPFCVRVNKSIVQHTQVHTKHTQSPMRSHGLFDLSCW